MTTLPESLGLDSVFPSVFGAANNGSQFDQSQFDFSYIRDQGVKASEKERAQIPAFNSIAKTFNIRQFATGKHRGSLKASDV